MRYIPATKKKRARAQAVDTCFRSEQRSPVDTAQQRLSSVPLRVLLRLPHSPRASFSVTSSGVTLVREKQLTRRQEWSFEASLEGQLAADLRIRLETDAAAYTLEVHVTWSSGQNELLIEEWFRGAPPRVSLNGVEQNRGLGVHLTQATPLPPLPKTTHNLFLIDRDETVLLRGEPVQIFIDDQLVAAPNRFTVDRTVAVRHWAILPLGVHRVVVVVPRRRKVLVDTDVVINGFEEVRVEWTRPVLTTAEVVITKGLAEVFRGRVSDLPFHDCMAAIRYEQDRLNINGVDIPDGIDQHKEDIQEGKDFAAAMVANYRAFLEQRRAVKEKKKRGEQLTPDEQALDAIESYRQMQDWVKARKRAEGHSPEEVGKTAPDGETRDLSPEPTDPFEELQKRMTLQVHEPSHVEQNKRVAAELGLAWEKLTAFIAAMKRVFALQDQGKTETEAIDALTPAEKEARQWGLDRALLAQTYLVRIDGADEGAEGEIQEYEAEIKFFTELLEKLKDRQE